MSRTADIGPEGDAIAVFDLDGTLCAQDTLKAFLREQVTRFPASLLRGWSLPLPLLASLAGRRDAGWLKERVLMALLADRSPAQVAEVADSLADRVAGPWLRAGARRAIDEHASRGDRLVLASASLDLWVLPVAARLGFHDVTCTRSARGEDGGLVGGFGAANCKGEAKLSRVRELLGERPTTRVVAYSDHHDDVPLLTWADQGVAVNPTTRLRRRASDLGLRIADWS